MVLRGTVVWLTTLAATEAPDVAAITGLVGRSGTLATTEAADVALFNGSIGAIPATGTLAATEAPTLWRLAGRSFGMQDCRLLKPNNTSCCYISDGSDGSSSIVDSGGGNHVLTAHGAAQIDTAQSCVRRTKLCSCRVIRDYVSADTGDYALGTDDFCIDFRVRLSSASTPQMLYDGGGTGPQIFTMALH